MYIGINVGPEHHITVVYCGHGESINDYARAVLAATRLAELRSDLKLSPLRVHLGATACFEDRKRKLWYAQVKCDGLEALRDDLIYELNSLKVTVVDGYEEYIPHVTLSYRDAEPPENPYQGLTVMADCISVVSNKFGTTNIKI